MIDRIRNIAALSLAALAGGLVLSCAATAASGVVSPLPRSDYTVRALCSAPSHGYAGCMSLELRPRTAAARARTHPLGMARLAPHAGQASEGVFGLTPQNLASAYQLPSTAATTQTIALIDAYNDPTAEADLIAYSQEFGLPECTKANGCFKQVNQNGSAAAGSLPFPKTVEELETVAGEGEAGERKAEDALGWGVEISLDMETAHAICQHCKILLVEANSPSYANLEAAEQTAAALGATEISNSWGGPEPGESIPAESASPFNHPGIVITASSGDDGYLNWGSENNAEIGYANFPASSPHVVAVGGTRLELSKATGEWLGESVWNGSGAGGGGCSEIFSAPSWQLNTLSWSSVGCGGFRAVADVSAVADPYTGVAIRDSTPGAGCEGTVQDPYWCTVGGTSLASPLIAAVFALAGGAGEVEYPARTLYENELAAPSSLHDIVSGSNGACSKEFTKTGVSGCSAKEESEASNCANQAICLAETGYDGPTGVGTPHGIKAFEPTGKAQEPEPNEGGGGSGGAGGGGGGGGGGTSGEQPSGTTSGTPAGSLTPIAPNTPAPVQLSAFALTLNAIIALNGMHPKISQIGLTFTINLSTPVRLTISKRVRAHHRSHWKTLGRSFTATAFPGRNAWRLTGHGKLSPGRYRITLTPPHAAAKSIVFSIG
ncbi:MAG TPA: S53 family peptidase [Solirubrobacteraceae bacterium]|nr:S53 family peptidase [Solirubrobacteraceae bacterium]